MRYVLPILGLLALQPTPSRATPAAAPPLDLAYTFRAVGEAGEVRPNSLFAAALPFTTLGRDSGRIEGEARGRVGPLALLFTASATENEGGSVAGRGTLDEAYFDFGSGSVRGTVGRKILAADVGYAFRPIDVLQRETRLQVLPSSLEGIDQVSLEQFSADSAWTIILAQPEGGHHGNDPKNDRSLVLRGYRRLGSADVHSIARFSERFKIEAGAGISAVVGEQWELHGSFLWQRRGELLAPAEAFDSDGLRAPKSPLSRLALRDPLKVMAGTTWTLPNGFSFLGEIWWDGTAPAAADWRRLAARARQLNALSARPEIPAVAVTGSLAALLPMFQRPSLSRRAALGHVAWTDPRGGGWSAALDVLRSLEDGGYNLTLSVAHQGDKLRLDAGVRCFGGKSESDYGLFPVQSIVFLGASLAF